MSSAGIETLPIWRKLRFRIDAGDSVLVSIPRFCGEHRILQRLSEYYRSRKYRSAFVSIARQPTTGEIIYTQLWDDVRAAFSLKDESEANDEMGFIALLRRQLARKKSRILLIVNGVEPGLEAKFYNLMRALHVLHASTGTGSAARFQFIAADEFLILTYGFRMGIEWSQLHTMKREANTPFSKSEIEEYLEAVSPHKRKTPESIQLTARLQKTTGGHLGLVNEACEILERDGWPSDETSWTDRVLPSLYETSVLENIRAAIREDKTGLAKTALDFVEPEYGIEYDSPRFSQLKRLGILYRHGESELCLFDGCIRTMMEGMASESTGTERLGTVHHEFGLTSFIDESYVPDADDFVVVHLSDIHIGKDHGFRLSFPGTTVNQEVSSLVELIYEDLKSLGLSKDVNGIVLSGDISCEGQHGEFGRAHEVIQELLEKLNLTKDQLLLVPGNHDVKWNPHEFETKLAGNREVSRDGYNTLLKLLDKDPHALYDYVALMSRGGKRRLRIVGFDSNHVEGREAAGIGYVAKDALDHAGKALDSDTKPDNVENLTWFVVHHHILPVCDASIYDSEKRRVSVMGNASQILATARGWGVEAILHGHQHQPVLSYAQRWIGDQGPSKFTPILVVGAGSCGAKRERVGPIGYNHYFVLARKAESMLVRSRTLIPGALKFSTHEDMLVHTQGNSRKK